LLLAPDTARVLPLVVPVAGIGTAMTAAAVFVFATQPPSAEVLAGVLILFAASALSEAFPVPIEGVRIGLTSFATVFIVATAVLYGWAPAVLVAFATMVLTEASRRRPLVRVAYNTSLYVLAATVAALAISAIGGSDGTLASLLLATLVASGAFYATDIALLAAIVARSEREPYAALIRRYFYWTLAPFSVMASVAAILVVLWQEAPLLAALLGGPLAAIALYQRSIHGALVRLRELDRLKDEFIAIVSHELRTPVASIYGAALTLRNRELGEEDRASMQAIIYRESDRLARLVSDVLWVNRLQAGRIDTAIEAVDAADLARVVVDAARAHLPPRVSLELSCEPSLPPVAADAEKLRQVLANLVDNAVKYSPGGGRVTVHVERTDSRVRFAVSDEGVGIPGHEQARIFEKFHRLDPNLTASVSGSGLGLYICREFVEKMNGRISVSSTPGEGSTFVVELPIADASLTPTAPKTERSAVTV
jgi:signal transduction histidine kinase